jgi:hypothetical protein
VKVHAIENGLHDFTTHILEIDVDTVRSGGGELFLPVGMLVVDGGIEAEFFSNPLTFFIGAGNANHVATVNFAKLPGDAAGGSSGGGNDESFAGLWLGDIEKAEVGGEAVDAESAEEIGVGNERNGRELAEIPGFGGSDEEKFLEAREASDLISLFEIGMTRFDDFRDTDGTHDFAELDGRHVLRDVGHPDAHGGIDGEICDASEGLVVCKGRNGRFDEMEDVGSDEIGGTGMENVLVIRRGHGWRIAERNKGKKRKRNESTREGIGSPQRLTPISRKIQCGSGKLDPLRTVVMLEIARHERRGSSKGRRPCATAALGAKAPV